MQGTVLDLVGIRHEGPPLSSKSSQSSGWGGLGKGRGEEKPSPHTALVQGWITVSATEETREGDEGGVRKEIQQMKYKRAGHSYCLRDNAGDTADQVYKETIVISKVNTQTAAMRATQGKETRNRDITNSVT